MTEYLIWLQAALGAGNIRAVKALKVFVNAENIYKATSTERKAAKIFTPKDLKRLNDIKIDYEYKDMDFDGLLGALDAGKVDIVLSGIDSKSIKNLFSSIVSITLFFSGILTTPHQLPYQILVEILICIIR